MSAKTKFMDALDSAMIYKSEQRNSQAIMLGLAAILEELESQK